MPIFVPEIKFVMAVKTYAEAVIKVSKATLLKSHFGMGVLLKNLLHIFRTPFLKSTSGRLLLKVFCFCPILLDFFTLFQIFCPGLLFLLLMIM